MKTQSKIDSEIQPFKLFLKLACLNLRTLAQLRYTYSNLQIYDTECKITDVDKLEF